MPKIVIFKGDAVENETRLAGRAIRLGRDPRNDIVLDDKSVSRFHAEVRPEGDRYVIVDLKSRNGVWVNGQPAKGKVALMLGTPVTLGAFELALEDDVGTGDYENDSVVPSTALNIPADQADQASRSGKRASMKPRTATTRRQQVMWSGAAMAMLVIGAATFAFIRYRAADPPPVAVLEPPPAQLQEPPPLVVEPTEEERTKKEVEQGLDDAKAAMGQGNYTEALQQAVRVLELDPDNQDAFDLKRKAESGLKSLSPKVPTVTTTTSVPPSEPETPGIPRRLGETYQDYLNRVQRIEAAMKAGRAALDKQDYATALTRFGQVDRDQKGYQNVDALITDTIAKQRAAFDKAMDDGRKNEEANRPFVARQWYQQAAIYNPKAAIAREKDVLLMNKMLPEATRLFNQAGFEAKTGATERASRTYQQVLDMTLPGDEIRERATKELEKLK